MLRRSSIHRVFASKWRSSPRGARRFESLESRCLLAPVVEQVADINTEGASRPSNLIEYNGALYFKASSSSDGVQWWRLDAQGAVSLVNDLSPRVGTVGFFGGAAMFNGKLHLAFQKEFGGSPLWTVDAEGDFEAAASGEQLWRVEDPSDFGVFQNALYFAAGSLSDRELWRMNFDGVAELVADIAPNFASSRPEELTVWGDSLYFSADDNTLGRELWRLDVQGQLQRVTDLVAGAGSSNPEQLTLFGGDLYFWAQAVDGTDYKLWKLDASGQAQQVADLRASANARNRPAMAIYNDFLYLFASDQNGTAKLWKVDALGNAIVVADVSPGPNPPEEMTVFNDELYFRATDNQHGHELWKFNDLGEAMRLTDFVIDQSFTMIELVVFNDELHFDAWGDVEGYELWKVDVQGNVSLAADIDQGQGVAELVADIRGWEPSAPGPAFSFQSSRPCTPLSAAK